MPRLSAIFSQADAALGAISSLRTPQLLWWPLALRLVLAMVHNWQEQLSLQARPQKNSRPLSISPNSLSEFSWVESFFAGIAQGRSGLSSPLWIVHIAMTPTTVAGRRKKRLWPTARAV